jgi:MoaD family protein
VEALARVKVKTFSNIRAMIGAEVVEVEVKKPETVGELFETLYRKYGRALKDQIWDKNTGEIAPFLIKLNERIIRSTYDLDTPIRDGDEIAIIFPVGGG